MADKLHGFTRDDLAALADGLETGYEKTVDVVEAKLESSTAAAARFIRAALDASLWQPMATAPKKQGSEILAWFQKVKLDEDDNPTTEVIGGATAQIERQGNGWTEPEWLSAHGSYYMEDWCFADEPALWHPLPPEPTAAELAGSAIDGVDSPEGKSNG